MVGPLAEELPGIFNFAFEISESTVHDFLVHTTKHVSSISEIHEEQANIINPLLSWLKEETMRGDFVYVGNNPVKGPKADLESSRRLALYPAYYSWCLRHNQKPLSSKIFSHYVIQNARSLYGSNIEKSRDRYGVIISGITLKKDIFDRDYLFGAPLAPIATSNVLQLEANAQLEANTGEIMSPEKSLILQKDTKVIHGNPGHPFGSSYKESSVGLHPTLDANLYEKYKALLGCSDLKNKLNVLGSAIIKGHFSFAADDMTGIIVKDLSINSKAYETAILKQVTKNLRLLQNFGIVPFTYKSMGISPRLIPAAYGESINSVKGAVRDIMYYNVAIEARKIVGMGEFPMEIKILDLDLRSCFTSILVGLYPTRLSGVQQILENKGLWGHILDEFIASGKEHLYNKPAVKVCTYSAFFQGGPTAMRDGILENYRKSVGLIPKEFRKADFYESIYKTAQEIAYEMNNSFIINEFREVSHEICQAYKGDNFIGPTGHKYPVSDSTFRTSFPSYLQSFEFALISQGLLNAVQKMPDIEIIGHYHDGVVICLPAHQEAEAVFLIQESVKKVGKDLGLWYPQIIEVKAVY